FKLSIRPFVSQDKTTKKLTVGDLTLPYTTVLDAATGEYVLKVTDADKNQTYTSKTEGSDRIIAIRGTRYKISGSLHPDLLTFTLAAIGGNIANSSDAAGQVLVVEKDIFQVSLKPNTTDTYLFNNGTTTIEGKVGSTMTVNGRPYQVSLGADGKVK